jgi:outer membrane receptor protein involved in Fe transport
MNPKIIKMMLGVLVLGLVISARSKAQVSGATVTGTVTDPSGGVIANAQIAAKNAATSLVSTTTTNSDGFYNLPNLLPGDYQVTVTAAGFSTKVVSITLTVGAKRSLDIGMVVGQSQQTVQVTEEAPSIQLATSTISGNVEGSEVRELPLNGRDWGSLATLQPGVVSVRTHEAVTQVGSHARGLGMQLSIGGNRPQQNTYRLNGIIINDYSNAGPGSVLGQNLGVDAIEEFSVLTSNYTAEYGFTSGGVVNAISRSGTSQFHGSAYEFLRNSALDAADFFENASGLPKAPFRRNQFGGSAGGPIWKDKIFIFGDYEGLRQSKGITHIAKVPSPEARNGILGDPSTGAPQTPFTVNSEVAKFLTFYHAPNAGLISPDPTLTCNQTTVICNTGRYAFSGAQVVPENYYTTRADVSISGKDRLNGSWYYDRSSFTQPDATNNVLDQFIVGRQGFSVEETHIFNPSLGNTVRFGYNRSYGDGQLTPKAINPAAADPALGISQNLFAPRIIVPGVLTTFTGGLNGQSVQNYLLQTYQVYDDAVRNIGKHNVKFGGALIVYHLNLFAPFIEDGSATFNSMSDFLNNIPHNVTGPPDLSAVKTHHNHTSVIAGYVQDDWKVRPSLTLNLGLRYEMETIPKETNGLVANLPTITTDPNVGPFNKFYFSHNPTNKNFEPRIGFAWDPFRNGKTAVRGGVGLFDSLPLPYELVINNAQTSPFHVNAIVTGCAFTSNPTCAPPGSFPHTLPLTNPPASAQTWNYVDTNIKRNYIYQWNLSVQRQLTGTLSLMLAYTGSRGIHNPFQLDDINTVFPTLTSGRWLFPNPVGSGCRPGACGTVSSTTNAIVPGQLINGNVAQLQTTLWSSMSYYNSLQVQVEKRMSHGLQVLSSFTWGKTIDTSSGSFAGDNFASNLSAITPWWDLKIVRGLADFNVVRNLTVNVLWDVPAPKAFSGPAGWIARGWQFGGIVQASSGVPVWALSGIGGDPMGQLNSAPIAIPDRVPGCTLTNPSSGRHGSLQYINPACFVNAQAPDQTFYNTNCDKSFAFPTCINLLGNLGRNTVVGPGLVNVDFSMVKNTKVSKISENFNVQFRTEFFNVFNHPNFAPPLDNLQSLDGNGAPVPGFGQLTALQVPSREIQFALKIVW